jgi:hypothetical protein
VSFTEILGKMLPLAQQLRSVIRVLLGLPVVFRWKDANGTHHGKGVTRDLSVKGMFVMVSEPECPPVSAIVRCALKIPSLDFLAPDAVLEGLTKGSS